MLTVSTTNQVADLPRGKPGLEWEPLPLEGLEWELACIHPSPRNPAPKPPHVLGTPQVSGRLALCLPSC